MFGLTALELVTVYGAVGVVLGLVAGYCLGALRERRRNQTFIAQELAASGSVLSLNSRINLLEAALDDVLDLNRATSVRVTSIETKSGISPPYCADDAGCADPGNNTAPATSKAAANASRRTIKVWVRRPTDQQVTEATARADDAIHPPKPDKD